MIYKNFTLLFFIFMFSFSGISISEVKIIRYIDNSIITNIDIEKEIEYLKILNPNLNQLNKNQLNIIANKSLNKEIIKNNEIQKYPNLEKKDFPLNEYLQEIYSKFQIDSEENFKKYLKENNSLTLEDIKTKIKIEFLWNELIYQKFNNQINIDIKSIENKVENLSSKERKSYYLSEIVFSVTKDMPFNKLLNEIKSSIQEIGFNNSANIYSISDSSSSGGKLGWVNENSLSKDIANQLSKLDVGQTTEVIKIKNTFLIIKIENIRIDNVKIDKKSEVEKLIFLESNKQLNQFSKVYYDKLKMNYKFNDN